MFFYETKSALSPYGIKSANRINASAKVLKGTYFRLQNHLVGLQISYPVFACVFETHELKQ